MEGSLRPQDSAVGTEHQDERLRRRGGMVPWGDAPLLLPEDSRKAHRDGTQETAQSLYREGSRVAHTAQAVDRLGGAGREPTALA